LAPLALAGTLGVGSDPVAMIAPLAFNLDGAAITLARRLSRVIGRGPGADGLARLIARRREEGASPLTFAVVYPYSTHNYLLRDWMAEAGIDPDHDVRLTVAPPSRLAELLDGGVVEGFCAGEPWNAVAVAAGSGEIVARAADLRDRTPDKVFGVTETWAGRHPGQLGSIVRALTAAAAWLEAPAHRAQAAAFMAEPEYLGVSRELIAPGLEELVVRHGAAGAPRSADAAWLIGEMIRWGQAPADIDAQALAARVYRTDLHEAALAR
ncbi:MAG: ABC transporter substrate-binding protein, partial [Caulobacterales bacterium]